MLCLVPRNSLFNCSQQLMRAYRLNKKVVCPRLDRLYHSAGVRVARQKDDGQCPAEFGQSALKLQAVQARHSYVEKNATRKAFIRPPIEQMLGRRMGDDPIARLFQASLNSSSKRTVVVDEVYCANQISNPQAPVSRIRSSYHCAAGSSRELRI